MEDRSGGSLFYCIKIKNYKIILDNQTIIKYNTINNKQHNFKLSEVKIMMNARLKNVFSLSSKVTVYVPATIDIDKEIDNKEFVDRAATLLSDCFGGATSTDALGYWTSPTAGLVKEKTTMVFAYASEKDLRNKLDQVIDLCEDLKKEMTQDAIALEINGEMFFI